MANPTITVTDEGLIPGADYSLAQLQRIDALLTTIERKASTGFNRNMPAKAQQFERQQLSSAKKELSSFGIEMTGTLKEMGRVAQQIQPQIRAALNQITAVHAQAGRAVHAVHQVGEAAKVVGSVAVASKGKDRMRAASQALEQADKAITQKAKQTQASVTQSLERLQKSVQQAVSPYAPRSQYQVLANAAGVTPGQWSAVQAARAMAAPTGYMTNQVRWAAQAEKAQTTVARAAAGGGPPPKLPGGGGGGLSGALLGGKGAHSIARGVAGAGNALFLTYGSVPHLVAAYAASSAVKNSISNFAELDQQLRFSQAVAEDYSVSIKQSMESVLATSRRFAVGHMDVAKAVQALTQAGVSAKQSLSTVNDVMALAITGEMDARDAAVTLAGATQAFGYSFSESARVADVFAKAAAISSASVQDITEAMKQASTVARGYGIEVEQVGVVVAALGKQNITGSPAGTAFRNLVTEIAAPKGKARQWQEQLGVSFYNAQGNPKNLLGEYIPQLRAALSELDNPTRARAIAEMFNERSRRLITTLLNMSQTQLQELIDEMRKAAGYTLEVAYAKNDNLLGDWKRLVADFNAVAVGAGSEGNNALRDALQEVRDVVNDPSFQQGLGALIKLVAGAGSAAARVAGQFAELASSVTQAIGKVSEFLSQHHSPINQNGDTGFSSAARTAVYTSLRSMLPFGGALFGGKGKSQHDRDIVGVEGLQGTADEKLAGLKQQLEDLKEGRTTGNNSVTRATLARLSKQRDDDRKALEEARKAKDAVKGSTDWALVASRSRAYEKAQKAFNLSESNWSDYRARAEKFYKTNEQITEIGKQITELERAKKKGGLQDFVGTSDLDDVGMGRKGAKAEKAREKYTFQINAQGLLRDALADSAKGMVAQYGSPYSGNYRITDDLSAWRSRKDGSKYRHQGIDVAMPVGTPLRAMADGIVTTVARNAGNAGHMLSVKHDDGTVAKYMHLSGFAEGMRAGARVTAGQQVALSGNTGRSSGPHLHMEFWKGGKPQDFRNFIGQAAGPRSQVSGMGKLNALLEADKPDDLVRKIGQHFDHAAEQVAQAVAAAERNVEQRYMSGQLLTNRDRDLELAQIKAQGGRTGARIDRAEADNYQRLIDQGGLSSDGRFQAERARDKALASAAKREFDADKTLYDTQAGKEYIDSLRQMVQGHDELAIKEQHTFEIRQRESAQAREMAGMYEHQAFVKRQVIDMTSGLVKELDELTLRMRMVKELGLDKTDEGRAVLAAGESMAGKLREKIADREVDAAKLARKDFLANKSKELSTSFAQALMSDDASASIRDWLKQKVLMEPLQAQIEIMVKPMMEHLAEFLFPSNGQGGVFQLLSGVGDWLGSVLKSATPSGGGGGGGGGGFFGWVGSLLGGLFGFANGGIMTPYGPAPLRKYANGGIANSPQLALFGEGSRPEAFVPLPDGRSIPVTMEGGAPSGAGVSNQVSITIHNNGSGSTADARMGGGSSGSAQFAKYIAGIVNDELVKQSRPGGMLTRR